MALEREYRLHEAALLLGYSVAALRKKIRSRELGYRKTGRIVTVPACEIVRLRGKLVPAIVRIDE